MARRYRSGLEKRLGTGRFKTWDYEPESFEYVLKNKYTPDFVYKDKWIEAKGFFRPGDQKKYLAIKNSYPDKELIFVFSDPFKPVRRGAKMTMSDWATKHGFRWYTEYNIPKRL